VVYVFGKKRKMKKNGGDWMRMINNIAVNMLRKFFKIYLHSGNICEENAEYCRNWGSF